MQNRTLPSPPTTSRVAIAEQASRPGTELESGERAKRLLAQEVPNVRERTFTAAHLTFRPGASAAPHRHGDAFVYAYVLDGAVRSSLDGALAKVYRSGEAWYEVPGAHHTVTENASSSSPAHVLVIFVSRTGEK